MQYVYVACAIIGWVLVVFQLAGGDTASDVDADADLGGDGPVGPGGIDGAGTEPVPGSVLLQFIRFSSLVFFLALFGTTGLVIGLLGVGAVGTLAIATAVGLLAGGVNSAAYALLRKGEASSGLRDSDLVGRRGRVEVPLTAGQPGRVMVDIGGRPMRLPARPHPAEDREFDVGAEVLVIAYEKGTAYVDVLDPEVS